MERNTARNMIPKVYNGLLDQQDQHLHLNGCFRRQQQQLNQSPYQNYVIAPQMFDVLPQSGDHMRDEFDHHLALPMTVHNDGDRVKDSSEEDEGSLRTEDGDDAVNGKKASKWHRMKWTDQMVKLLITVVSYLGEDYIWECVSGSKRKFAVLQKKGKWKLVSEVMAERGCFVSPQQCEDKFNDLNKRYKRLNDILGRGISCRVVENPALLERMNHLSDKTKNLVKKILSSKHLFYEEMCSYHNGNRLHLKADPAVLQSLKMALGSADEHNEDEIDEDNRGGDSDDRGKNFNRRMVQGVELRSPSVPQDCNRKNSFDMNQVLDEGFEGDLVQQEQNLRSRSLNLEAKKLQVEMQMQELEKQRMKWQQFSKKKDRELDKMRVENERMKLENDQLALVLKHEELKLRLSH